MMNSIAQLARYSYSYEREAIGVGIAIIVIVIFLIIAADIGSNLFGIGGLSRCKIQRQF